MDLSFRNYCLCSSEKDVIFWNDWIALNPRKYEEVQQAKQLFILLNGNNTADQFTQDRQLFLNALNDHLHKEMHSNNAEIITGTHAVPGKKNNLLKIFLYGGGVAACGLLIAISSYFIFGKQKPLQNSLNYQSAYTCLPGERKSILLPDGSLVLLNSGSTISIVENFNDSEREILLKGEAYFEVAHNRKKPFIIHTANLNIKVLGTKFDVKAYPNDKTSEATLIRGSVEVTMNNEPGKKVVLKPHQKIVVPNALQPEDAERNRPLIHLPAATVAEKTTIIDAAINPDDSTIMETSWTKNKLVFNDETFAEVAIKLERWYGVEVTVDEDISEKYKFTGIFENETINQALKALQLSLPFHYRVVAEKIFITP